ncbi:MAG TPA: hypothetical protein VH062_35370 [Polyangiaceae bacterium]|nr:hypothetical protein [Polyangiaceae bacterium]
MAGPPGAIAGAVIGGVIGVLAGAPFDDAQRASAGHDAKLDRELGISEGEIGAPNLPHVPAKRGAFSAASTGADTIDDSEPAEGPMPPSD